MEMDFGSFLSKMGNETLGKSQHKERRQEIVSIPEDDEYQKPKRVPEKNRVEERQERYKNEYVEEFSEKQKSRKNESVINEEFLDKAYDYAQGVIKVIRNNFNTTEEKVVMLESLQKAINYYLSNLGIPQNSHQNYQPIRESRPQPETMSEDDWNKIPVVQGEQIPGTVRMNDLTGREVKFSNPTGDYNPRLNLGIKIAPDGKQEVDLSAVTQADINEMKVLAGMIGPEAERKNEELKLAKIEMQNQLADKSRNE